jgi:putative ABC transport system substrate-binding protein
MEDALTDQEIAILCDVVEGWGANLNKEKRKVLDQLIATAFTLEVRREGDITLAFGSFKGGAQALYVCADPLTVSNRVSINTLALGARLPTMHDFRDFVEAGGLMSHGPNFSDQFRRAADIVDKILRGAKPGDIPVEQADKFELVVNLKTAKALGLTIPESFLALADEVIE